MLQEKSLELTLKQRSRIYFLPASFDPALKRGRRLNGAGIYNVWYFAHAHVRVLARVGHETHG